LAYTPYNVAVHLAGPKLGGLRHDYRRPKHPFGDKFMLAAGHCAPTCYALWIVMGEALYRKFKATGDKKYYVAPKDGFLAIDALMGGVIDNKYTGYDFVQQWTSYGWNVMTMANGHDYDQIVGALKAMDDVDANDRRPIMVIGKTIKGYWPTASNGKIAASTDQ